MRGMATNRASNRDFFMVIYVFLCLELQEGEMQKAPLLTKRNGASF